MTNSAYETVMGSDSSYQDLPVATVQTGQMAAVNQFDDVDTASKQALWKQLASVVGMDVMNMRLSLPIWLFEPTTALTRMVETFEFNDLLDRAATVEQENLRDCLVAAFVVSAFSHTERIRKPFNPVLGETYEFINPANKMKFYAEQVSHHPPISVSRCEGKGWVAGEVVDINATYHGNSVEVHNVGSRYIEFSETGERYTWTLPKAVVSNLFVGGAFVDHFGTLEVTNHKSGTVSRLELAKCGWFSAGRYEVTGDLLDDSQTVTMRYKGAWNKFLDCERVSKPKGEGATRLWMAGQHIISEEEGGGVGTLFLNCTKFTMKTLALDEDYKTMLPPTDSRLRPDRLALEKGDRPMAAEEKLRVEHMQRSREEEEEDAKYFRRTSEDAQEWEAIGNYWSESRSFSGEKRASNMLW